MYLMEQILHCHPPRLWWQAGYNNVKRWYPQPIQHTNFGIRLLHHRGCRGTVWADDTKWRTPLGTEIGITELVYRRSSTGEYGNIWHTYRTYELSNAPKFNRGCSCCSELCKGKPRNGEDAASQGLAFAKENPELVQKVANNASSLPGTNKPDDRDIRTSYTPMDTPMDAFQSTSPNDDVQINGARDWGTKRS